MKYEIEEHLFLFFFHPTPHILIINFCANAMINYKHKINNEQCNELQDIDCAE